MRVLCVYHDEEPRWLERPPSEILSAHEVTEAYCFEDAMNIIHDPERGTPPFDIVLSDLLMPKSASCFEIVPYGPLLLQHVLIQLIRGLGIFIPENMSETFMASDEELTAVVASKKCSAPNGQRDWKKLLSLVEKEVDKLDSAAT